MDERTNERTEAEGRDEKKEPQRVGLFPDAAEAPKATTNDQTGPTIDIYLDKNNYPVIVIK